MSGRATPARTFNLRIPASVYAILRRHAFERNVAMNALVSDILRLWIVAATDPTDPFFCEEALGVPIPEPPPERFPGYLDGLVFTLPSEEHVV